MGVAVKSTFSLSFGLHLVLLSVLLSILVMGPADILAEEAPSGLPVENEVVRRVCGPCHRPDESGLMSRISFERKSPEGWQQTVKRMLRTELAFAAPAEAREIVHYLSENHGLAPAEARPAFYRAEKRPVSDPITDREIAGTCARCHAGSWFLTQRRTEEEWRLLKGMHLGYFPMAEFQAFTGPIPLPAANYEAPAEASAPNDEEKKEGQRVDRVLEKLAELLAFDSKEWQAWVAKRSETDLSGRWLFSSYQAASGPVTGVVEIEGSGQNWSTQASLRHPDGSTELRSGRGVLYGGYTWRGRASSPSDKGLGELRESLMLSDDGTELEGRFFKGEYGELGSDVTLTRLGSDPQLVAAWPRGLTPGESTVRVLGANLPTGLETGDIDLGSGVSVTRIVRSDDTQLEIAVEVQADAPPGLRNVKVAGNVLVDGIVVYDKPDYVLVRPEESLARLGGVTIPKQVVQFEAVAFHRGLDDEPLTPDDFELGPVVANWSIEEYHVRPGDDDAEYVGRIDNTGLFTPNVEGPNPARGTNNWGDVYVVARYGSGAEELKGRAQLIVTAPLYAYWEQTP